MIWNAFFVFRGGNPFLEKRASPRAPLRKNLLRGIALDWKKSAIARWSEGIFIIGSVFM